jgi:hypothetical protein
MRTMPVPRLGQRARRRKELVTAINRQAQAIVTVEERRAAVAARVDELIAAYDDFASRGFFGRLKLVVLGK